MPRHALLIALVLVTTPAAAGAGTPVEIDGMRSTAPAAWTEQPVTGGPRFKQFTLPRAGGDSADAELVIFHFGPGQGGSAEDNVARWKTIFEPPAGKTIEQVSATRTYKVGAVKVTAFAVSGTYLYKARPIDPALKAERRPGHRMIALVFESPKGPYFFRLVGPEKTVARHEKSFERWIKAFR
jgi:hypothetical protein